MGKTYKADRTDIKQRKRSNENRYDKPRKGSEFCWNCGCKLSPKYMNCPRCFKTR